MRARVQTATLSIFVPYPPDLKQKVADHSTKMKLEIIETPEAAAFEQAIDFAAVREEFRRVAKKLDMPMPEGLFPVSIWHTARGIVLTATVQRPQKETRG